MDSFKCPHCGRSHPDTTIFCVQKQRAVVKYPTALLVTLLLLAFAAVLVTAFTQPTGPDDNSSFLATVFIYKPWLFYSFVGLLLLVWEGSFLRSRPFQRWLMWGVTVAALLIVGLFTAKPDLVTTIQNSQGLKDFFTSPWLYIIANLLFVLFWLYQTVRRRMRRDKTRPPATIFSDSVQEENAAIAETEYTSGDLLAGAIIFLFSSFVFPFLYMAIADYGLTEIPQAQAANQTLQPTWLFDHFNHMTYLRIGGDLNHPTQGISIVFLDLAIAALLFAVSTISLLIVTYNQGLQEIEAVDDTGKLPRIIPTTSAVLPSAEALTAAAEAPADLAEPTLTTMGDPSAAETQEEIERTVVDTVVRVASEGLRRALLSLRIVAGSAALSIRNILWPIAIFVGAAFTAVMSAVVYTYLHSPDKFPNADWTTFSGTHGIGPSFLNWLISWLEIGGFGLVVLLTVTIAIALLTRAQAVLPDAFNFLRWFGLLVILTYWIFALAVLGLNAAYRFQEFLSTTNPKSFFYINNPWPLAFDLTAILSLVLFLVLAVPRLFGRGRKPRAAKATS